MTLILYYTELNCYFYMSTSYSLDLREKVIQTLENGSLQRNVAKRYKISLRTVQRYWRQYKETRNIQPKPFHKNKDKIKVDNDKIIDFIEQNKNSTLKEIAKKMNVNFVTIHYGSVEISLNSEFLKILRIFFLKIRRVNIKYIARRSSKKRSQKIKNCYLYEISQQSLSNDKNNLKIFHKVILRN